MFRLTCIVDAGVACYGNDDRALVQRHVVDEGSYEETSETAFAAVCDGVGGEACGYEAAGIAAAHFATLAGGEITVEGIRAGIACANNLIIKAQRKGRGRAGMATTIAGIYVSGEDCIVFNVGDSRVYRYRPPYIAQLSKDHSALEEIKALGLEPKPGHEGVITRYLGGDRAAPDIIDGRGRVLGCDVYIVCTDGISDFVTDPELEDIMSQSQRIPDMQICRTLVDAALSNGSNDNLSVVLVSNLHRSPPV